MINHIWSSYEQYVLSAKLFFCLSYWFWTHEILSGEIWKWILSLSKGWYPGLHAQTVSVAMILSHNWKWLKLHTNKPLYIFAPIFKFPCSSSHITWALRCRQHIMALFSAALHIMGWNKMKCTGTSRVCDSWNSSLGRGYTWII